MADIPTGTPRWVKVFAAIAAIVAVLVLIALLSGQNHGPGRHSAPAFAVLPIS